MINIKQAFGKETTNITIHFTNNEVLNIFDVVIIESDEKRITFLTKSLEYITVCENNINYFTIDGKKENGQEGGVHIVS